MSDRRLPRGLAALLAGSPPPLLLLGGAGAGLAPLLAERLSDRFRREGHATEFRLLSPADFETGAPVGEWRVPSFFAARRVFLLPDLGEVKKGGRKDLREYLAAPEPSVTLVAPCADRDAYRTFSALAAVRAEAPGEEQAVSILAGVAVAQAEEAGKTLLGDAADFLARWVGADYGRLRSEVTKLVAIAHGRTGIGEEDIRQACVPGGGVDPFRLAENLLDGRREETLTLLRRFAATAETGDWHALVGAVAWKARQRVAAAGRRPGAPRGAGRAERTLSALALVDRSIKGESRLLPGQVFEICVLKLLA